MMMNLLVARLSVNGVDIQSVCEEKTEFFFLLVGSFLVIN